MNKIKNDYVYIIFYYHLTMTEMSMEHKRTFEYINNNIPDFKERIENLLVIYNFDISTTRKRNKHFGIVMWKIIKHIDYALQSGVPVENDDMFNWAVGNLAF